MTASALKKLSVASIRGDIYGGLTAAVVALPLALAFGVTSGIGPIAGLYGAIAVGFFAAVFGGTPSQVSGPTGPMTVVMAIVVAEHADNLPEAFAIVFLAGLIQIFLGVIKVGRFVSYTPYPVVSGFMSGIGVIIILIQTLPFFGLASASGGPLGAMAQWSQIPLALNLDALTLSTISLAIMIVWPTKLRKLLPPALASLIVGSLLGLFIFGGAPIIGAVPTGLPDLYIPTPSIFAIPSLIQPALILALLGCIDSLLTSLVADSITRTRHNSNKELIGQGLGNMAAGIIGGLPGAGATMRTVVNVKAGGTTPISGAFHSIVLLSLLLGLGSLAANIPHAVLSGILIKVGWDIVDWRFLTKIRIAPRPEVFVMLATLGLTVFVDLIVAVAVGLILASFITSLWMEKRELKGIYTLATPDIYDKLSQAEKKEILNLRGEVNIVILSGNLSYASARALMTHISTDAKGHKATIFDFSHMTYVDTSAALAIEEAIEMTLETTEGIFISGLAEPVSSTMLSLEALKAIPKTNITRCLIDAIRMAHLHINS